MNRKIIFILFSVFTLMNIYSQDFSDYIKDLENLYTISYKEISKKNSLYLSEQGQLVEFEGAFTVVGDGYFEVFDVKTGKKLYRRTGYLNFSDGKVYINCNYILKKDCSLKDNAVKNISISNKGIVTINYFNGEIDSFSIPLYKPTDKSINNFVGNGYQFSEVVQIESNGFKMNFIELSTVEKYSLILDMQQKLFEYLNTDKIEDVRFKYLETLLTQLWMMFLQEDSIKENILVDCDCISVKTQYSDNINQLIEKIKNELN